MLQCRLAVPNRLLQAINEIEKYTANAPIGTSDDAAAARVAQRGSWGRELAASVLGPWLVKHPGNIGQCQRAASRVARVAVGQSCAIMVE